MGRLSTVALVVFCAVGCENDDSKTATAPKSRAAAVQATAPPASARPKPSAEPERPKRALCEGQMDQQGKELPDSAISTAGAPAPPKEMTTGKGKWTWVNFWAAWCVPCKEEIPRLRSWEKKLSSRMRLTFVSLDDDTRQLQDFLKAQPASGLRSTYWLKDGEEREEWLADAGLEEEPELPAHLLVDPEGKIRCTVQGAVEDADLARVTELLGG